MMIRRQLKSIARNSIVQNVLASLELNTLIYTRLDVFQRKLTTNSFQGQQLPSFYDLTIQKYTEKTFLNECGRFKDIRLHLITPNTSLWLAQDVQSLPFPEPFWAFVWPGSYAIACYLHDHPEMVAKKRVFDFGSGCGLNAIVAKLFGAHSCTANDIDAWACRAALLNAQLNDVDIHVNVENLIGSDVSEYDFLLAGDMFYDKELAIRTTEWFEKVREQGTRVLVGDPGRQFLSKRHLSAVASYPLLPSMKEENYGLDHAIVWEFQPN